MPTDLGDLYRELREGIKSRVGCIKRAYQGEFDLPDDIAVELCHCRLSR
jgi:hypothetical protein